MDSQTFRLVLQMGGPTKALPYAGQEFHFLGVRVGRALTSLSTAEAELIGLVYGAQVLEAVSVLAVKPHVTILSPLVHRPLHGNVWSREACRFTT